MSTRPVMQAEVPTSYNFPTLPDLLRSGMNLVFVGISPIPHSVERGHYSAPVAPADSGPRFPVLVPVKRSRRP